MSYALADELLDIYLELRKMIADVNSKSFQPTYIEARTLPTSHKLASDGGCQLTDTEKTSVIRQLREARSPAHIPLIEGRLLVQMVGSVILSYPPGGDDLAYMTSVEPLIPYLVTARAKLMPPTSERRIPLILLLHLTTF